ncbi:origin recognition complex subunit 6 [Pieris rapae]|uniref:origin recognition complex subunit 6 n=1 Tax=Pieris rapae TaxID=64459 RepID=UPI001E280C00|nr:origin recognition complex subunit 6 [Pieris rapae]
MATSKTLRLLAVKLGLADEVKVLSKAAEFERLLQIKSTPGNNFSDTSKIVILLDLAASLLGTNFDEKAAVKYSGLKGPSYRNSRKVIENLLELDNDKLSISALCLNLQCTGVQDLAESIIKEYETSSKVALDLTLPQYVCMAVYQACRINKVKITKSKIIEKSRLKPGQWSELDTEWTKIVDEKFLVKKRGRPPKVVVENENEMEIDESPVKETTETKIEPYEDWKRRMLEQAYKELRELENQKRVGKNRVSFNEDNLPRRSSRMTPKKSSGMTPLKSPSKQRTPQKFSPYKSPEKARLRLSFPII